MPLMNPWLIVTITGTTGAAIVGALTYSATVQASDIIASGTGLSINGLGLCGSYLVSALLGDLAGVSVRVASQVAGHLTQETIRSSGRTAAALTSATTATLTALTFTAGSYAIQYTLEYGGMLSETLAKHIAEQVLGYSVSKNETQSGYIEDMRDSGWVVIDIEDGGGEGGGGEGSLPVENSSN